jgi:arsenite transporter
VLLDIEVPWQTLLLSVGLYVVIPLAAGAATRAALVSRAGDGAQDGALGEARVARFVSGVKPFSILGLLATVVLLFGFQGHVILDRPLLIALIAVPLLIQSYGIFIIAYVRRQVGLVRTEGPGDAVAGRLRQPYGQWRSGR